MKYKRFEELPVWQAAIELAVQVYALTGKPAFLRQRSLRDQLERAAVSVSNNIAEGFERGTNNELLSFLYIARGSAGEVRSMLCLLEKLPGFLNLESEIRNLNSRVESVSKQLGAWIQSIQNSDQKGQRFVTDVTRKAEVAAEGRRQFLDELERLLVRKSHPAIAAPRPYLGPKGIRVSASKRTDGPVQLSGCTRTSDWNLKMSLLLPPELFPPKLSRFGASGLVPIE
jgi:four helix bundle protein